MTSVRVLCGLCLVLVLVATSAGSVGDFHEVPSVENECRSPSQDIPFSRAVSVPASDAAVNATVKRVNESAVRITYHDLESDERNFGPSLPTWVYELGIRVASADGFDVQRSQIATTLVWNSSVRTPSVTFITERQPNSEFEDIGAAIQSEWAFLPVPPHTHPTNVSVAAGQPGFVGEQVLLLGDYELYSRQVGCHEIQLYVPTALDTAEPPSAIVESMEAAARELRVGWRYETVRIFGVGSPIRVGGRAFTHEAWVHVNSTFRPRQTSGVWYPPQPTLANAWLHEYAHTRQRWVTNASVSSNAQWLTEAVPTYYMISETERHPASRTRAIPTAVRVPTPLNYR